VSEEKLTVTPLNDEPRDFLNMFGLRDRVERSNATRIVLDFTYCSFIRHTGVAFLAGLIRHSALQGKVVRIEWSSIRNHIYDSLRQNGFASAFGDLGMGPWPGTSVPFREDRKGANTPAQVMRYLREDWLGRRWVNVSAGVAAAIQSRVWEIYNNCFDHSESAIGAMSCGQLYSRQRRLGLCVADFGIGIPALVRSFLGRPRMPASETLQWAFRAGTSTKSDLTKGRGIGLNILKEFIKLNDGKLSVYSGRGQAHVTKDGESFVDGPLEFHGTMVDIRFVCDDDLYVLSSEVPSSSSAPLF
jgi:hypothetical protein